LYRNDSIQIASGKLLLLDFFQRKTQIGSRRMSNFSDKEDRMLIQLAHRQNVAKGKISWSSIATKMRTKKNPEQLRLRVVCLKKRFGNILANFPRWYFETAKPSEVRHKNVRSVATKRSDDSVAVDRTAKDKEPQRNGSLLDFFNSDDDTDASLSSTPRTPIPSPSGAAPFKKSNDSKTSFGTASTRKKLRRRRAKTLQQPLCGIETSPTVRQRLRSGNSCVARVKAKRTSSQVTRTDCNTAKGTFPSSLASFNACVGVGAPVTNEMEIANGTESHGVITTRSVGCAAAVRQLAQKVSQILILTRKMY
jgi:hypothetical protein